MSIFVFGEILWDVYPEKKVLGGAPFNFAAHLARLGEKAYLLTAIGDDELGRETANAIDSYGLSRDFVSVVDYPTGICQVTMSDDGIPSYDLCPGRAYDNIPVSEAHSRFIASASPKALYFGSLAQRSSGSRATLKKLIKEHSWDEIFFDINIRQSYYTKEIAEDGFNACSVLKISQEEFPVLKELGICSLDVSDTTEPSPCAEACRFLAEKYNIDTVLLTLGKDGAMSYTKKTGKGILSKKPQGKVVSTVGAGDSFFAAYANAFLKGKAPEAALDHAVTLSDYVVQHLESVPEYTPELSEYLK
ncbi:MAG: carbohydrate kinase [Clostridia bacterium]|nr:carbohydrate kinase [Clostridia bacterium]